MKNRSGPIPDRGNPKDPVMSQMGVHDLPEEGSSAWWGSRRFEGEGRSPQEGAETSYRTGVGMPGPATFTQSSLNHEKSSTASRYFRGFVDEGMTWSAVWRRGRDLNSRSPCEDSGFQDRHVRPLRHPSIPCVPDQEP